jgi:cytochrome c oxidase subunit 4
MTDAAHTHDREPEEPHDVTVPTPHHPINYYGIFAALVVLTVVTVLVSFHRFQSELVNLLLAMLVAAIKATLVAMFFMHLKFEGKLIYTIFLVPLGLCVLLTCALIPDVLLPALSTHNSSLHLFNFDWVHHLIQGAMGAE